MTGFISVSKLLAGLLLIVTTVAAQPKQPANIWALDWSNDGKYVALGGDDSTVWVYATENYSLHQSFKLSSMVRALSWHPKESLLAIATADGVQLLQVKTQQITIIDSLKTGGRGIAWNHTGELLALADGNGVLQILNRDGRKLRSIRKDNDNSYFSVDWHPTKDILVTGGDEILLFDTSGAQLAFIHHRNVPTGVLTVKWHPSGEFFVSGDYGHDKEGIPNLLQFWKEDGTLIREMRGISKTEYRNIRWNHSATLLATASDVLRIWDTEGKLRFTGPPLDDDINGVAWSKDDSKIITASFSTGSVRLWSSKAGLIRTVIGE